MNDRDMRLVEIYLDDHWAGAAAGIAVARRLAANNSNTQWGARLSDLVDQIEEDDETLARIRSSLGVDGGKAKRVLALAGERLARLKLNGRLISYSPLSRLLECEGIEAGVSAKRRLWSALLVGMGDFPELSEYDFERLMQRADDQLDLLRQFHSHAASIVFGGAETQAT